MNQIIPMIVTYSPMVVGFVMPWLVEIINRDIIDANKKFVITLFLCLLVAVMINIQKILVGSVEEVLTSLTLIFTESQVVFKLYFQKSDFRKDMQRNAVVSIL